ALDRGATVVRAASSLTRELSGVRRWRDGVAQLGAIAATARREMAPGPIASCFDAPLGRSRAVAWRALPLGAVHDAAKRVGPNVTLNDAMVALVGSGVAAWLAEQRRASQPLRVRIPVSLHAPGAAASANRDSFIDVDVSLDGSDVVARLRAITMQTRLRKATHDAEHVDEVRRAMAALPFGEHMVAMSDGAHQFSLCISNVVGPRQPIAVDGVAVGELHSFVEVAQHHDLRASVISCGDRLSLSLCADAGRVDPEVVMRGVDAAWDRLRSEA
ncbi:MAG: WS/DGAT domain-containing protein, partial [Candidatus Dormibacteria bacterium]